MVANLVNRLIRRAAEIVSEKFERYVGKDLRQKRINGSLDGGLVGRIQHVLALAL